MAEVALAQLAGAAQAVTAGGAKAARERNAARAVAAAAAEKEAATALAAAAASAAAATATARADTLAAQVAALEEEVGGLRRRLGARSACAADIVVQHREDELVRLQAANADLQVALNAAAEEKGRLGAVAERTERVAAATAADLAILRADVARLEAGVAEQRDKVIEHTRRMQETLAAAKTGAASKDGVTARVKALGRRLAARGAALHAARADVARLQAALEQRTVELRAAAAHADAQASLATERGEAAQALVAQLVDAAAQAVRARAAMVAQAQAALGTWEQAGIDLQGGGGAGPTVPGPSSDGGHSLPALSTGDDDSVGGLEEMGTGAAGVLVAVADGAPAVAEEGAVADAAAASAAASPEDARSAVPPAVQADLVATTPAAAVPLGSVTVTQCDTRGPGAVAVPHCQGVKRATCEAGDFDGDGVCSPPSKQTRAEA